MIRKFMSREFFLFLLTGGTAAIVNFLSRILYNKWLSFSTSVVCSYISGMLTAFLLAKFFVFKNSNQSNSKSILFFILVNFFAIFQTWIISIVLANYVLPFVHITSYVKEIAHGVGIVVPVFTSYLGHRKWSFREAQF